MTKACEEILLIKDDPTGIGEARQKMLFFLNGIYIDEEYLFIQLGIKNRGNIQFDLSYVGFFTGYRSKRGNKKKARQDETISPVFVYNDDLKVIDRDETLLRIYVFKRFTLVDGKKLYIQFWEGNGGERKVELAVRGNDILRAKRI